MAKKKYSFVYKLVIYIAVLCCISFGCLLKVKSILVKYENGQPETFVKGVMQEIIDAETTEEAAAKVNFPDGVAADVKSEYINSLKGAELTCKSMIGNATSEEKAYAVLNGDTTVAKVTIKCVNEETKLVIFPITTWETLKVEPAFNVYNLSLPTSLSISVDGTQLEGTYDEAQGVNVYEIQGMTNPTITISDAFGNSVDYSNGMTLELNDYTIEALSCYTVNVNGSPINIEPMAVEEVAEFRYVSEYCSEMPKLNIYSVSMLGSDPVITLTDANGTEVAYEQDGNKIVCNKIQGADTVPAELTAEFNVLTAAEQWSLFLSQDLSGANYGFANVAKYFEKDSYMYNNAYQWATSIDITFTSNHSLANPPFSNEKVSNFVRYSEDCYSCDVYLVKTLTTAKGNTVNDVLNSTFYMYKKDGNWIIVDMQEIVE